MELLQIFRGASTAIFCSFNRLRDGFLPAGDQRSHEARRRAEGGRAFRSIQYADSPARSSSDVDQPATLSHAGLDRVDRPRNRWEFALDRGGDFVILAIHESSELDRGHVIQVSRR